MPAFFEQLGQASQPCSFCTFLATAICSSRLALSAVGAYLVPPCRFQVFWSNCRPPL
jgi:hypothetical protein